VGFRLNPLYGPIPQMTLSFERPHTTVTESDQWDDQCPALDSDGRCAVTGAARCADGPATKVRSTVLLVTRACWRYETSLSCQYGSAHRRVRATGCRRVHAQSGPSAAR
jgi:conjugal transfer mating pair stabilization protein TraN